MAKEEKGLDEVYNEILGEGDSVEDKSGSVAGGDPAYMDEDYSDDAGDGEDPRDKTTEKDAEDKDVETDENPESDDTDESEDYDDQDDDDEDEELIPEHLVEAGRNASLSDDLIVELAESQPHVLEALAKTQEEARKAAAAAAKLEGAEQKDGLDKPEKKANSIEKLEVDFGEDDEFSPTAKKAVQSLVDQVNSLTEKLNTHDQSFGEIQQQRQAEGTRRIDAYFDSVAEEIPALGKAETLNQEQTEARLFAFRVARGAQQTMEGLSDEDALAIGVNALKGQFTEQQVRTKVVADLNKQKKRFTARPKGRRQVSGKKGKSVEDRALGAINKILDDPAYHSGS